MNAIPGWLIQIIVVIIVIVMLVWAATQLGFHF